MDTRSGIEEEELLDIRSENQSLKEQIKCLTEERNRRLMRPSFGGHICDDLCEDIMDWLPLEDKFRLQLVSKQFRRCLTNVIKRQTVLKIRCVHKSDKTRGDRKELLFRELEGCKSELYINAIIAVLKAMTNIRDITFDYYCSNDGVLNAMADNCRHIRTVDFPFYHCDEGAKRRFAHKFSHSLRSFNCHNSCWPQLETLALMCANVTAITCYYTRNTWREILATNEGIIDLNVICFEYHSLIDCLGVVPKLRQLKRLAIYCDFSDDRDVVMSMHDISAGMTSIAVHCRQLAIISVDLVETYIQECMHWYQHYSQLRRLTVKMDVNCLAPILDISYLKHCHHLTHLAIEARVDDATIDGIASIVPALECLTITAYYSTITNKGLISISMLRQLKTFRLEMRAIAITDEELLSLVANCRHLHDVYIYTDSYDHNESHYIDITIKSLNAMIEKALKYPKIDYNYYFRTNKSLDVKKYLSFGLLSVPNLNIAIEGKSIQ